MNYFVNYGRPSERMTVNTRLTFAGLRDEFIRIAERIYKAQKESAHELTEIKRSGIYSDTYIKRKEDEFKAKDESLIAESRKEIEDLVAKVIDTKKTAVNRMLTTAPSREQIDLLQSLEMQGKSLSEAEINAILPELTDNYRALKTMQTIARNVGFSVILPAQYDYEEIKRSLERAEAYLSDRVKDMGRPVKEWSLASDCFYGSIKFNLSAEEWEKQKWEDPIYSEFAEVLDGNMQTAPIIEPVKELTEAEAEILDGLFANKVGKDLDGAVVRAARTPYIRDMIERSEYAEHLTESEAE